MAFSQADILQTLADNWGYSSFRPKQLEIIESVLSGCDTLGLLPTGGGKSITFQVPALMLPGLTIVVTPLISLMKDQVDNLRQRGINAVYLFSGLSRAEQTLALEKCNSGRAKILYLSPEKLSAPSFLDRISSFDVSMIVVDEAHCISQWGYDFRPSYLKIAALRKKFNDAPVLALTASATPEVASDIKQQLEFRPNSHDFALSFARPNISFVVRHTPDSKENLMLNILNAVPGSAIVYVRSRKRTREIAETLLLNGISTDFYHAGLAAEDKSERQNRWKQGETRVMVATNAFGMGIDKPDVRVVIHHDLPSSLEEYYQEAGRAGRDGLPAYAVLITSPSDKALLTRRISDSFPPKPDIRRIYSLACDFLEVAEGEGFNHTYDFDLAKFASSRNLQPVIVNSALSILSRSGVLEYADDSFSSARIMVTMRRDELYSLQLSPAVDKLFQLILRTYPGIFADFVAISEASLSMRLNISQEEIYQQLLSLSRMHVISYVPRRTTPYIFFPVRRETEKAVIIPRTVYEDRRQSLEKRIEAMRRYAFSADRCRVETMLEYFGEKTVEPCGKCDYCRAVEKIKKPESVKSALTTEAIENSVAQHLEKIGESTINELFQIFGETTRADRNLITETIRRMADDEKITLAGLKCKINS